MQSDLTKITEKEIIDSLSRSGYLLESEITKKMLHYGFFVESNISVLDPQTGKSREIDLVAELYRDYDEERAKLKTVAFARYVFEIKNNNAPLVLLTKYEFSPNSELYTGLKTAKTFPKTMDEDDIYYSDFFDVLFNNEEKKIFTQYCSFTQKKNEELMAYHPENIYSALNKLTYYCEDVISNWNNIDGDYNNDYLRNFLYLPIILINDHLYELEYNGENESNLQKVELSHLVFNYHYKEEHKTSIIHIVTKSGLKDLIDKIKKAEKKVEKNLMEARIKWENLQQ